MQKRIVMPFENGRATFSASGLSCRPGSSPASAPFEVPSVTAGPEAPLPLLVGAVFVFDAGAGGTFVDVLAGLLVPPEPPGLLAAHQSTKIKAVANLICVPFIGVLFF